MTTLPLLGLILLAVLAICVSSASDLDKLDRIEMAEDKSVFLSGPGESDAWFDTLNQKDLEEHWSFDEDLVFNKKMKKLRNFETTVFVEVRLVGFNGDGYRKFTVNEGELMRYLEASGLNLHPSPYVVQHEGRSGDSIFEAAADDDEETVSQNDIDSRPQKQAGVRLPMSRRFRFKVTKAPSSVAQAVAARVQDVVTEQAARHRAFQAEHSESPVPAEDVWYHIPHSEVDALLAADYHRDGAYVVYLLSPSAPFVEVHDYDTGRDGVQRIKNTRRVQVRYVYSELDRQAMAKQADPALLAKHTCETTLWASDKRFAYIDFTAGPVSYGHKTSGDGVFTELSLPRLDRLFQRHREDKEMLRLDDVTTTRGDSDGLHDDNIVRQSRGARAGASVAPTGGTISPKLRAEERVRRDYLSKGLEFVSGLAHAVRRTVDALVAPPVYRFPVPYYDKVLVNVLTIADHELPAPQGDSKRRWELVSAQLEALGLEYQEVEVDAMHVQFEDCELCVSALTAALRTQTTSVRRAGADAEDLAFRSKVHQYVDSAALVDWLEHFEQDFWRLRAGKIEEVKATPSSRKRNTKFRGQASSSAGPSGQLLGLDIRVVNVFVYDLATREPLLLDQQQQAVAVGDVVVAVQTRAPLSEVNAVCNGQLMQLPNGDASRAVLGALLNTLYGVMPSGLAFNAFTNATETDSMWAVGMTPFGPYAHGLQMHFGLVDAAHRHVVLSDVVEALETLEHARLLMKRYRKSLVDIAKRESYLHFVYRTNLLRFKLHKVQHLLSVNQFNRALFYSRSARHDAHAIADTVLAALRSLDTAMVCASELHERTGGAVGGLISSLVKMASSEEKPLDTAAGQIGDSPVAHAKAERALRKSRLRSERLQHELHRRSKNRRTRAPPPSKTALTHEMNDVETYLALIEDYERDLAGSIWVLLAEIAVFATVLGVCGYCLMLRSVSRGNNDVLTRYGADVFDITPQNAEAKAGWCSCCVKRNKYGRYD